MSIRIGIVGLPPLLADVIADAFTDDGAVEIDRLPAEIDLTMEAAAYDVIIMGVTDPSHPSVVGRITRATRPKFLAVGVDGHESWIYRIQPRVQELGAAGPAQIRAAVLSIPDAIEVDGDSEAPG
jgi:hypothetical protein